MPPPASCPVTVVVATRNRREELVHTIRRLAASTDRPRVIVVDNASDDGSAAAARAALPGGLVVALPANLGAAARNVGLRLATTPLVAFSDDDSWWADGALALAGRRFADDPRLAVLAARILVGPGGAVDPTCLLMENGPLDEHYAPRAQGRRGVTGFVACGTVVNRRAVLAAGGFEARLMVGGEEELLALRLAQAGWKLVYEPAVVAHHHPSPRRVLRQRERMVARNRALTAWLSYPAPVALRRTLDRRRKGRDLLVDLEGVAEAGRAAGWVAARRDPVDAHLASLFAP